MIIKSMSRKVPSFDQLIGYMDAGASSRDNNIYYNLYTRKPEQIEDEFLQNSQYLHKRKNGVFMYHEVISITRSDQISEQEQIDILRQTVYKYIQSRASENLVYAVLHDDKADNLHYHLLISSNKAEDAKRHRLTKAQFSTVKKNLEIYVLEQHPELKQAKLISKAWTSEETKENQQHASVSNKEFELKRRTQKASKRDSIKENLERIFANSRTREEFLELLESESLKIYKRGKHWGVLDEKTNRKHRFQTLGVAEAFERLDKQLTKQENTVQQNPDKHNLTERVAKRKDKIKETKQSTQTKTTQAEDQDNDNETHELKDDIHTEAEKREEEMKKLREQKAKQTQQQQKKR